MTAIKAGAPIDEAKKWSSINWKEAERQVRRLQMRIAKAVKENRWHKVKALQHLLTRSFYAKLLAVKRVTSNKGKKTPGVLTAFYGKAPEPSGGLHAACADVDTKLSLDGHFKIPHLWPGQNTPATG